MGRAGSCAERGVGVEIQKIKAHTSDTGVASYEQQAANWRADHFADQAASRCNLSEREMRPILKKDQCCKAHYKRRAKQHVPPNRNPTGQISVPTEWPNMD
eukprot:82072-Karenia_brevis.AAC.1